LTTTFAAPEDRGKAFGVYAAQPSLEGSKP
jgi:hypothetical protein